MTDQETRCGLVAVIGAPNAGKSTLVNALVGQKVAIVSPKAQTTRARLMGIAIQGEAQILLLDTPGIFDPKRRLDRAMVAAAWEGARDAEQPRPGGLRLGADDRDLLPDQSIDQGRLCLLYTSPSPRDRTRSRMPSSA